MILWNLISIVLIILTLTEAHRNNYAFPKFASWATVAFAWFIGSIVLFAVS